MKNILLQSKHLLTRKKDIIKIGSGVMKKDCVVCSSFPKTGSTWFRFIATNVFILSNESMCDVNFHVIKNYFPEIRHDRDSTEWKYKVNFPLFFKTHQPFFSDYIEYKRVLITRNPVDSLSSYYLYLKNEKSVVFNSRKEFLDSWEYGIPAWNYFHEKWRGNATLIIRYEDLIEEPVVTISGLYESLGYFEIENKVVERAVSLSEKSKMSKSLSLYGDPMAANKNFKFVSTAKKKNVFSEDEKEYINRKAVTLL